MITLLLQLGCLPRLQIWRRRRLKPRAKKCVVCGRASSKLCDFVVSPPEQITHKKTCDKPLCHIHAVHIPGKDEDYCGEHADVLGLSLIL